MKLLGFTVTSDSRGGFSHVTPPGKKHGITATIKFIKDNKGLPFVDIVKNGTVFAQYKVETICGNLEGYTKK